MLEGLRFESPKSEVFTVKDSQGLEWECNGKTTLLCINIGARVLDNDTYNNMLDVIISHMDGEVTVFGFHPEVVKLINRETGACADIRELDGISLYKV